jgi:hypothetical protein
MFISGPSGFILTTNSKYGGLGGRERHLESGEAIRLQNIDERWNGRGNDKQSGLFAASCWGAGGWRCDAPRRTRVNPSWREASNDTVISTFRAGLHLGN